MITKFKEPIMMHYMLNGSEIHETEESNVTLMSDILTAALFAIPVLLYIVYFIAIMIL